MYSFQKRVSQMKVSFVSDCKVELKFFFNLNMFFFIKFVITLSNCLLIHFDCLILIFCLLIFHFCYKNLVSRKKKKFFEIKIESKFHISFSSCLVKTWNIKNFCVKVTINTTFIEDTLQLFTVFVAGEFSFSVSSVGLMCLYGYGHSLLFYLIQL